MPTALELHLAAFIRPPGARPFVLGHRGVPSLAPENSIRSFQAALDQGADGVELDVRMTADGALVLSHDDLIFPSSKDGSGHSLRLLTLDQIRKLGEAHQSPIATLREALTFQARTGALLNVELKGDVPAPRWMARKAADEIGPHGGENIVLSSFSVTVLRALRTHLPDLPSCLLFDENQRWMQRVLPLETLDLQGANPQFSIIDRKLAERVRKAASLLGAWTVNDGDEARRLAHLGVDLIISNYPGRIVQALL